MDNDNEFKENNITNEIEETNDNQFFYYSRIIMMIILIIEFIFNIIFLAIISDIKANVHVFGENIFNMHKHSINAIFSFFFIFSFVFILEIMASYGCFIRNYSYECLQIIFKSLNHIIILVSFFICQFLFLIQCVIIPVFSQRVKSLVNEEKSISNAQGNIIKKKYIAMEAICYIFLCLILFLDFMVINLYKGICCQMEEICQKTKVCIGNFSRWFIDKLSFICCIKDNNKIINQLEEEEKTKDDQIKKMSEEIKNQIAENIRLNLKVIYC